MSMSSIILVGPDGQIMEIVDPEAALEQEYPPVDQIRPEGGHWSHEVRHVSMDDPIGGICVEHWQQTLRECASDAPSLEILTEALVRSVGYDMVYSHNTDPDLALQACATFAQELWDEAHPDPVV